MKFTHRLIIVISCSTNELAIVVFTDGYWPIDFTIIGLYDDSFRFAIDKRPSQLHMVVFSASKAVWASFKVCATPVVIRKICEVTKGNGICDFSPQWFLWGLNLFGSVVC